MNNKYYTVCGIVEIEGKVLLVRHTYGNAKDRILLPGGFVQENELPTVAVEREILEETGVTAKAKSIIAMQFKLEQWCAVFAMDYISGTPLNLLLSTQVPFPNKISCFVSRCVSLGNSFPSVRQEPSFGPWKGSPFLQHNCSDPRRKEQIKPSRVLEYRNRKTRPCPML